MASSLMHPDLSAAAATEAALHPDASADPGRSTYAEILRSSVLIGGSTALNVAVGIVRTKATAVLLGPSGFGLMGVFTSLCDLARSVAEMGVSSSGVRQIAEANHDGRTGQLARTVRVLRRTTVVLGLAGALILVAFARPISIVTFGTDAQVDAVRLLSVALFLQVVAGGQGALVQGTRRIADLARIAVWGSTLGTLVSLPIIYLLGADGIVPGLVAVAGMAAATSWWYSRKVTVVRCTLTTTEVRREVASLLKLGSAFMGSAMLMMGAAYLVRLLVIREVGLTAAGLYQAAWAIGGLYVGFVLQAMGADFYPRLVGAIHDDREANRLVNEQAQVSLLLAGPGVIGTIVYAPLVVAVLYSTEFAAAVDVLRWIGLGMALRVISWPMGYIIVAKNRQSIFFGAELAWTVVNIGLSWSCIRALGLAGAGMAFFGSYVFHGLMVYVIARRLSGFRWSPANRTTGLAFIASIGCVWVAIQFLPTLWATLFGTIAMLASAAYSIRRLVAFSAFDRMPGSLRRLLQPMLRVVGAQDPGSTPTDAGPVGRATTLKPIWIDLDNSPHVPFFKPIIAELRARGFGVVVTARDAFQVTELTRLHGIDCVVVGKHFGKHRLMKAAGLLLRSAQLSPRFIRQRPALAVSHGSRAQTLLARILGIPSIVIADYEFVKHVTRPDWIIVPEIIPATAAGRFADRVLTYPGIKEDVYTSSFRADPRILDALGIGRDEIVVTVRPPATEAHYHNPESEALFAAVIDLLTANPQTRVVVLPRNHVQKLEIVQQWPQWIENRKLVIPDQAIDGLNLVWHSDLVISGGGTMNREAAALGVPVYSVFRGTIGAVDRYLADKGRLILLRSVDEVMHDVALVRRDRVDDAKFVDRSALEAIVGHITAIARDVSASGVAS